MFPLVHDLYAAVPSRVWWAPWRWSLDVYRWEGVSNITPPERIATNIAKAECIGLMKVLGYAQEIT